MKKTENNSWIPKRMGDNPYDQLRRTLAPEDHLSPRRTQDMLEEQETVTAAKLIIFELVGAHILATYGPRDIDIKLQNFQKSWDSLFDKYGTKLIKALSELIDDIKFVNHNGVMRKVVLRKKLNEMEKRERGQ
ncbi:TPA: hypothetical protein DIU27_00605 [Candidatus Collierbacteria bacterium]|nr:hypothetical protein [Candidatus Collierbacteria bacterium]